jgi:hypothetical protein
MRRVACYTASSTLSDNESLADEILAIKSFVFDWLGGKGRLQEGTYGPELTLYDGRRAGVTYHDYKTPTGQCWECQLDEPSESGRFLTRIVIGGRHNQMQVFIELRAGGEALNLQPLTIDPYCPEIYRTILNSREWYTGAAFVRTQPIPFHGRQGAAALLNVIQHPDRNLPLVLISTIDGKPLVGNLAEVCARDLAGLAIVATADEGVCWALTEELGREWSCYNQSVRMYWPLQGKLDRATAHPWWTVRRLLENAPTLEIAAQRLRSALRRQLLALSTYTIAEPSMLLEVRHDAEAARLRELRERANETGDWQEWAEELSAENDRLRMRLTETEERRQFLEDQVANLTLAAQYRPDSDSDSPLPLEVPPDVSTVADAVSEARARLGGELVFGADVEEGVDSLDVRAGPPEKIFDYLGALSDMTKRRRNEGLGKDMLVWLRERGIKASDESETVLNNMHETRKRTWDDGSGRNCEFSLHLKPKDGTSPDQCVRIYFRYDEGIEKTIVAWVGRHP